MAVRTLFALATVLALTLGFRCGPRLRTIVVDEPSAGALYDDPVSVVHAAARVGTNFGLATVEVRIDGVDLVAALGLVPPFSDEAGSVFIGGANVVITEFSFTATDPRRIQLVAGALPLGPHDFEVEGTKTTSELVSDAVAFEVTGPFALEADVVASAGLPAGPLDAGAEGVLLSATLGQPFAAPPVPLSGGGELRPGFVEVSEARAAGGTP